jgi:hypothetical protein
MLADQGMSDDDHNVTVNLDNEYMKGLVESYDKKQAEKQKKNKARRTGVEKFYEE